MKQVHISCPKCGHHQLPEQPMVCAKCGVPIGTDGMESADSAGIRSSRSISVSAIAAASLFLSITFVLVPIFGGHGLGLMGAILWYQIRVQGWERSGYSLPGFVLAYVGLLSCVLLCCFSALIAGRRFVLIGVTCCLGLSWLFFLLTTSGGFAMILGSTPFLGIACLFVPHVIRGPLK